MATRDIMMEILGSIQDELADVKRRLGAVESWQERADLRFTGLEGRLGGVEGRLGGVEGRLGGVEGRLGGVEGRLGGVEVGLESLRAEMAEGFLGLHAELQQVIGLLKHMGARQRATDRRVDAHSGRIAKLEER